jgi:HTH-type transcriptional regulator, sugar sensing transcriptional regulator
MNQKLLEEAGLTATEARIYLSLLEKGACRAGEVSRHTSIHRRSVYDAIERLIEKGLVSYIKTNNRRYFEAASPERLLELLREKEDNIKQILPEMQLLRKFSEKKKEVLFFRGKQAIKTVFDDQIKEGKEICVFGDAINVNEIVKYYFTHFDKERIEKNIRVRMLFDEGARKEKYLKKIPLADIRFIPKGNKSPVSTNIYANKVSIIIWEDNPKAILMADSALAESFGTYFEFMWKLAEK